MIDQFVSELQQMDIKLWFEGDRLRYKAPKEILTPALLDRLKAHKEEIRTLLSQVSPNKANSQDNLVDRTKKRLLRKTRFPILHFDYWHLHAFIMQIYGEKEFTLFSPHQSEYLYPVDRYSNRSFIPDIDRPDLNAYFNQLGILLASLSSDNDSK